MFPCSHNLLQPRPQAFSWPVPGVQRVGKAQESGGNTARGEVRRSRENTARGGVRRSRENTARGGVRREGEGKGTEGYCSLFQAFR